MNGVEGISDAEKRGSCSGRRRIPAYFSAIALAAVLLAPQPVRGNAWMHDGPPSLGPVRVGIAANSPSRTTNFSANFSAARIRVAVLYGAGEFSTFWRRSPSIVRSLFETVDRTPPLNRQVEDEWIAMDKAKHVAFSFLWTLGTQYAAVNKGGLSEHRALPISITSSALIGVTKEYYDLHAGPTRYFSARDLVADALGIVLAAGVILL